MAGLRNLVRCMLLLAVMLLIIPGCKREKLRPHISNISCDDMTICGFGTAAEYSGGLDAWFTYLRANIRYPEEAIEKNIEGTFMVSFTIGEDGGISKVEATSGPDSGGLRQEAIRVISASAKWTPTMMEGRAVESCRTQPVVFQLQGE